MAQPRRLEQGAIGRAPHDSRNGPRQVTCQSARGASRVGSRAGCSASARSASPYWAPSVGAPASSSRRSSCTCRSRPRSRSQVSASRPGPACASDTAMPSSSMQPHTVAAGPTSLSSRPQRRGRATIGRIVARHVWSASTGPVPFTPRGLRCSGAYATAGATSGVVRPRSSRSRSAPPAQPLGSETATSASGYQIGPNSGP